MKTYGANDWTEVASLSRGDSKRRAKACRARARQAARAQVDDELADYYAAVERCCREPKVRGGRCDNCGRWVQDEVR